MVHPMKTHPSIIMALSCIGLIATLILTINGCGILNCGKIGREGKIVAKAELFYLISENAESRVNKTNLLLLDKSYYLPHRSEVEYILKNWMRISPDHDYGSFDDCDDYAFDFVNSTRKYYRSTLGVVDAQSVSVFFWVVHGHALAMVYCADGPVWIEPRFPLKPLGKKPKQRFLFAL